jgi:hypothetical protein
MNNTQVVFNDATTQTTAPVNTNANVNSATAVAGTGISVTGITTTGAATHTITNTGVTSVTAGTGISVSASTGGVIITNTSTASGTVTSVATGNGLSGGTITSTGTLSVAAPGFNTVGSSAGILVRNFQSGTPFALSAGANYSAGAGNPSCQCAGQNAEDNGIANTNQLSGTWRYMGPSVVSTGVWSVGYRVS